MMPGFAVIWWNHLIAFLLLVLTGFHVLWTWQLNMNRGLFIQHFKDGRNRICLKSLQILNYFRALCFLFKWQKMDEYLVFLKFLWHGDALEQNVFSRFFWSIMLVTNNFKSGHWKLFTALILATILINHFVQTGKHFVLTKMSFFFHHQSQLSYYMIWDVFKSKDFCAGLWGSRIFFIYFKRESNSS